MKKNKKSDKIIDCALVLLKNHGDHGLTMRQVAQSAEMSLSNVQYYFKSKDELLKALADRYFNQCLEEIQQTPQLPSEGNLKAELHVLFRGFLAHGLEVSEMCRIFREYWAIATRNKMIEEYLHNYYKGLADILSDKLEPVASNPQALATSVSVIIPFVEGYTITASSLPSDIDEVTEILTATVMKLLANKGSL